ncbi:MAG: AmmeMemoRadiSam system protein B [Candidatus Hinthialibacter sp.]
MDPLIHTVDVIKPVVAGRFYPSDPAVLARDVRRYIDEAETAPAKRPVLAVLAPHAGYVFSGPIAGCSFRHVQDQNPDTVLIVALSHHVSLDGGCAPPAKQLETPLGRIAVDLRLTEKLLEGGPPIFADAEPFLVEHSVEVNLPFVQTVFPRAMVTAVLVNKADGAMCRAIGRRIAQALRSLPERRVLIVVSSDMSHYPPYEVANRIDKEMLSTLETLDPESIWSDLNRLGRDESNNVHCVMCGGSAMLSVVEAARELGAREARTLCYRNSGDALLGDSHRVVGYGALAIYAGLEEEEAPAQEENASEFFDLTHEDKRTLLAIARRSVYAVLRKESYEPYTDRPDLKIHTGAFVTLRNHGELRGCLGRFEAGDLPLEQLTAVLAAQSATHDIRFKPVALDEVPDIDIQISVLTPRRRVNDVREIEIGKHGLQIQGRSSFGIIRSGTLLPQVAVEQKWGVKEFLSATCVKAGLDADAWQDPHTEIWKYGALVFGDLDFNPPPYQEISP